MAMQSYDYARSLVDEARVLRQMSEGTRLAWVENMVRRVERDVAGGRVHFSSEGEVEAFARYVSRRVGARFAPNVAADVEKELRVTLAPYGGRLVKPRGEDARVGAKAVEKGLTELAKIDRVAGTPLLFFLGAGASKPEPSNIPLVGELLAHLWERSNQLESKPLEKVEAWCDEHGITNIEEMLTAMYVAIEVIRRPKVHGLLRSVLYPSLAEIEALSTRDVDAVSRFRDILDTFFSLLVGTMLHAEPNRTHEAVARFVKHFPDATILTTNYDACLDLALDSAGVPYHYVIRGATKNNAVKLIKMHGSINWFYCEDCQGLQMPSVQDMRESTGKEIPYPLTGMCPHCLSTSKQFIVPPTALKYLAYPPIVQVWDEGRAAFETARMYVVVGYSLSDADDYLAKMLLKAVGDDPEKHLVIVDTSRATIDRFRGYITRHASSFNEKRIHALEGSGADLVPRVVETLLGAWDGAPKPQKRGRRKKAAASAAAVPSDGSQPE